MANREMSRLLDFSSPEMQKKHFPVLRPRPHWASLALSQTPKLVGMGLVAPAQEPYSALAVIPSGLRLQLFVRRFTELPLARPPITD